MKKYIILTLVILFAILVGYNAGRSVSYEVATSKITVSDDSLFNEKFSSERWGFEYTYPEGYVGQIDLENDTQKFFSVKRRIDYPTYEESFLNEGTSNDDYYEGICSSCSMTIEILPNFLKPNSEGLETPEVWFASQKSIRDDDSLPSSMITLSGQLTEVTTFEDHVQYTLFNKHGESYDKYTLKIKSASVDREDLLAGFNLKL